MKKRSIVMAAALAAAPLTTALAADRVWTGAGDGVSWNDPLNWDGGAVVPSDGDNLLFPDVISQSVDPMANRTVGALTFNAPDAYVLSSPNALTLTLGGTNTQSGAGTVTINPTVSTG